MWTDFSLCLHVFSQDYHASRELSRPMLSRISPRFHLFASVVDSPSMHSVKITSAFSQRVKDRLYNKNTRCYSRKSTYWLHCIIANVERRVIYSQHYICIDISFYRIGIIKHPRVIDQRMTIHHVMCDKCHSDENIASDAHCLQV